ncbi:Proline/betaine transporter [Pandoraea pneumonica]|uniref:Proline/betaine transporter n=1 Tax=Pandoraea pneumonica TaxID=2508299 RepID=A0A5E4XU32_9BURK|nr:MFS transporter [Pandoraea pneumonica]VVE39889.1 Proline/betaine transporter [Pandoraea pneumonica]
MNNASLALSAEAKPAQPAWRAIAAATIGNALEWFDLVVYGFFAVTISRLFFPAGDGTVSLLLTLGTFGVSFFMRPLGAIVLGVYADKAGRKAALTLSITLMMIGTLLIAVMPTYASIGVLAPVGLVFARMIQGFSAGGEFGSSTAFLAEQNPARRGFFASWQASSQGMTTLLASVFGAVLTSQLSDAQMQSWGWRIPFLFGLMIGPVAYYIRTHMDETPEFQAVETTQSPLADTFANQKERLLLAIGVVILATVSAYLILFMPTYAVKQLGVSASTVFTAIIATGVIQTVGAPIVGHLSDKHGRTGLMLGAAVLFLLLSWPAFYLLDMHSTFGVMIAVQVGIGIVTVIYYGGMPALLSELFPTQIRTTGMSIAYNLAVTIFGGFAPFIITWLIQVSGSKLAPSFYLMGAAVLSMAALLRIRALKLR